MLLDRNNIALQFLTHLDSEQMNMKETTEQIAVEFGGLFVCLFVFPEQA